MITPELKYKLMSRKCLEHCFVSATFSKSQFKFSCAYLMKAVANVVLQQEKSSKANETLVCKCDTSKVGL